jgi:UDP-galactopyranose mutase
MDIELLGKMAELRPDWHFVMIGPVVKISEEDLPRSENIYYLGGKDYKELPAYLSGWDVALMPFAMNESTKYISPTKTPEYLAAGLPVVSTPIRDVVRPYGDKGLVHIASTAEEFVAACEKALAEDKSARLQTADDFLSHNSWDKTFGEMSRLIDEAIEKKPRAARQAV